MRLGRGTSAPSSDPFYPLLFTLTPWVKFPSLAGRRGGRDTHRDLEALVDDVAAEAQGAGGGGGGHRESHLSLSRTKEWLTGTGTMT